MNDNIFRDNEFGVFRVSTDSPTVVNYNISNINTKKYDRFFELLRFIECSKVAALYFTKLEKSHNIISPVMDEAPNLKRRK